MLEIYELTKVIKTNALALKSKAMSDYDRDALERHMNARLVHRARLQKRLDRQARP